MAHNVGDHPLLPDTGIGRIRAEDSSTSSDETLKRDQCQNLRADFLERTQFSIAPDHTMMNTHLLPLHVLCVMRLTSVEIMSLLQPVAVNRQ